jgi:predicted transcriptional regulator
MSKGQTLREQVLQEFLKNPKLGPQEMTKHLNAKYNSVKAIYAKLYDEGLLLREGRGNYSPNLPGLCLHLIERVAELEKS